MADNIRIGRRKLVVIHFCRSNPGRILMDQQFRLGMIGNMHAINIDAKLAVGIAIGGVHDELADLGINVQFFLQLAFQALRQSFTRFQLAAGKFPYVWQRLAFGPLGNKNFAVTGNNGCAHIFHDYSPSLANAVLTRAKLSSRPSTAAISVAPPAVVSLPLKAIRNG